MKDKMINLLVYLFIILVVILGVLWVIRKTYKPKVEIPDYLQIPKTAEEMKDPCDVYDCSNGK